MDIIYIIQAYHEKDDEFRNVCFFTKEEDAQLFVERANEISEYLFNHPEGSQKHDMDEFYYYPEGSTISVQYYWEAVGLGELE